MKCITKRQGEEEYPTNNRKEANWIDHILRHVTEGYIEEGI
jgi:hypothetical protein